MYTAITGPLSHLGRPSDPQFRTAALLHLFVCAGRPFVLDMFLSCWFSTIVLLVLALVDPAVFTLARPLRLAERVQPAVQKGVTVPLGRRRVNRRDAASSGLGDFADL